MVIIKLHHARTRGEIDLVALLVAFVSWARPTVYRPHLALQDRDENKDSERRQRHLCVRNQLRTEQLLMFIQSSLRTIVETTSETRCVVVSLMHRKCRSDETSSAVN